MGEDLVADLLRARGCDIIARNLCFRGTEIDIIAQKEAALYVVEVKTRARMPDRIENLLSPAKRRALRRGVVRFLGQWPKPWTGIRLDLALVISKPRIEVAYFPNAFPIEEG